MLYTVRDVLRSRLLREPQVLSDKIVIDCNNRSDRRFAEFRFDPPAESVSLATRLAADVPEARVVKAFNTIPAPVIDRGRERLAPHRVSVFLCADAAGEFDDMPVSSAVGEITGRPPRTFEQWATAHMDLFA